MDKLEMLLKKGLLYVFSLLNAIDMSQSVSFIDLGIESNQFAVHYPYLWFPFKFVFTFGFPIGLYKLDVYLQDKEDKHSYYFLRSLVGLLYFTVLIANIYFFRIVLRNMSTLGRRY